MQLYQGPRNSGGDPALGSLAPFPILLRVPYFAPGAAAPPEEAVSEKAPSVEPKREAPPSPWPTPPAAQSPAVAPPVAAASNPGQPPSRAGRWMAALFFVLVVSGLAAHWYCAPRPPVPPAEEVDPRGETEMIIVPALEPITGIEPPAPEGPTVELLKPIEAELGPDILPIEEGKSP